MHTIIFVFQQQKSRENFSVWNVIQPWRRHGGE